MKRHLDDLVVGSPTTANAAVVVVGRVCPVDGDGPAGSGRSLGTWSVSGEGRFPQRLSGLRHGGEVQ